MGVDNTQKFIQYGCGWQAPNNWRNFDSSPSLRFERLPLIGRLYTKNEERFPENVEYGDIVKGLPVPSNSCELVYCSHVLEHLSLEDFRIALRNTYKMMAPDGVFRLVMPDFEYYVQEYISNKEPGALTNFFLGTLLGKEKRNRKLFNFMVEWLGNSQHLFLWDYKALEYELRKVGFLDIRRAQFGDSIIQDFGNVEAEERWTNCLGVECKK